MIRTVTFLLTVACFVSSAFAQVPPGDNYNPAKHENPIITFVESKDFKPSTYKDATAAAGVTLLGLSKEEGTLQDIALADAGVKRMDVLRHRTEVTFYPVVRQTFKLTGDGEMILHSFKAPKIPMFPPELHDALLQEALASAKKKPSDRRFGPVSAPEQLGLRGTRALMFEKDKQLIIAWQEDGVMYTAIASLERKAFFRILDDLL